MAIKEEGVLTIPIAIFTVAIIYFTVVIVRWLNRKTSESIKEPSKSKEQPHNGSHPKHDQKQKKKMVNAQKSHSSPPAKFEHSHLITSLKGHTAPLTGGDFSPSGKHFITASQVSHDECEGKGEESSISNGNSLYEEDWITRSDVTPSDTEDSVTSSSSGGSKMTRRQRKNKKKKRSIIDNISGNESVDKTPPGDRPHFETPALDHFSPKFYFKKIGMSLKSLHKYLLPMCLTVQDRVLSGFPFETQTGIYVFKACSFSNVEAILAEQTLVSEELKDAKFTDEETSNSHQRTYAESYGTAPYGVTYSPPDENIKNCIRCKCQFGLAYNTECYYHSKRLEINERTGKLTYPCCGGSNTDSGCDYNPYHVYRTLQSGMNGPLSGYKSTSPINRENHIYSLDCEMVYSDRGFEVGKATLVSLDGEAIFDHYIRPKGFVYDYVTKYSGLTAECFRESISFEEAQSKLLSLISSFDILIGHSLEGDLAVLQIVHRRVVDSSLIYQLASSQPSYGSGSPLPRRQALKVLVFKYFGETIQGDFGHSSYEDAIAALNLVLLKVSEEVVKRVKVSKVAPTPPALHLLS